MTAQQLRNSILQQAIQGRLVPQDPNDEPARVLLEKIRTEKSKKGKPTKKELAIAPIVEDDYPFTIPPSWRWERFGNIVYNRDAERIPLSVAERSGLEKIYDYYGASSVIDKVDRYLFEEPLLLVGEDGANLITRSTPIAFIASGKYWVNNHAHVLDCMNLMDIKYLMYYINAISLADYVTGTAQPKMNQEKMNSIPVAVPPLAEQRRIVAKIEELMPLVEKYGKAQSELDTLNDSLPSRLRQSILQEAIQGKLVEQDPNDEPASVLLEKIRKQKEQLVKEGKLKKKDLVVTPIADDEKPFDLPSGWEWCRYIDIACCELGKTKNPSQTTGIMADYLCSINIYWNKISLSNIKQMLFTDAEKEKYLVKKGDMLICEGGDTGRTAIWDIEDAEIYYQNALHRVRFYGNIDSRFFMYQMMIYKASGMLDEHIKGETIQHFVLGKLQNLPIPLPPLAEQRRIVAKIEELFAEIDKLK